MTDHDQEAGYRANDPADTKRGIRTEDHCSITSESPGVRRIKAIASNFTFPNKVLLFTGIFLIAYAYGLDGQTRTVYNATATSDFQTHSLLSTINVVRAIVAAACQPAYAKIADVFGRTELILLATVFYVIGTAVEAASHQVNSYAGGILLYQIGYTGLMLLVEVLIADTTSLRNRLIGSIWPAAPFIINTWISGDVTSAIAKGPGWRWGVGMWCIILPGVILPIVLALSLAHRRAKQRGELPDLTDSWRSEGFTRGAVWLFWQTDFVGLIFLAAFLSLILIPFTLAGGLSSRWNDGDIIAMLVIGIVMIPVFAIWESKFAKHPAVPFHLLANRSILGALLVAVFLNFVWTMQGDYLYSVLIVAFGESVNSATRISSLYSFASVLTSVTLGVVVRYTRYIKPFQIAGILIFTMAMGLLVKYRGEHGSGHSGLIGAQVVLGIGGGLFAYPTQVLLQAATRHEHVAVITALYLSAYQVGSALGNSVSGAIWTNTLPAKLNEQLGSVNATLAAEAYASPFTVIAAYPMGTPERDAIVQAYNETQRLLCITGVCLCIPLLLAALIMRNPRLEDTQSLPQAEAGHGEEASGDASVMKH